MTKDSTKRLIDDIKEKASNNKDNQCWIKPSTYGFGHSIEETKKCAVLLEKLDFCKIIAVEGKDLLYIEL